VGVANAAAIREVGRPTLVNAGLLLIQASMRGGCRTQLSFGKLTTALKKRSQDASAIVAR
jgi:hypothetical protein